LFEHDLFRKTGTHFSGSCANGPILRRSFIAACSNVVLTVTRAHRRAAFETGRMGRVAPSCHQVVHVGRLATIPLTSPHRCRLTPGGSGPAARWLEPAAHNGLFAGSSSAEPTILLIEMSKSRCRCRRRMQQICAESNSLRTAAGEALKDPKLVARLSEIGGIPKPMTLAEFGSWSPTRPKNGARQSNSPGFRSSSEARCPALRSRRPACKGCRHRCLPRPRQGRRGL
jgi:hypothetical protein